MPTRRRLSLQKEGRHRRRLPFPGLAVAGPARATAGLNSQDLPSVVEACLWIPTPTRLAADAPATEYPARASSMA